MIYCTNCGEKQERNQGFCTNCGNELIDSKKSFFSRINFSSNVKKGLKILGVIVIVVFVLAWFSNSETTETPPTYKTSEPFSNYDQSEVIAPVVNVICPHMTDESMDTGGSGTILTEDGFVLTNSHIIPQDEININTVEEGCIVVLPDPETGEPLELYWADPIVIPEISDNYDLAFLQIYDAFYDEEEQAYAGTYPRVFPAFDDSDRCVEEYIQLGEPVRIFGYPAISGGYSLTVTDGVVSSFPGDGLIVTSAKVSHGNSGGLAVDRNGCMIGVPSLVSGDEYESLGVIISSDLIYNFMNEVSNKIDSY